MAEKLLRLSREVRFGLHEHPLPHVDSSNGLAGNPALVGLTPFVAVEVIAVGVADPRLGMLVNIKLIDAVVRENVVEMIRAYYCVREDERAGGDLALHVLARIEERLRAKGVSTESVKLKLSPYLELAVWAKEPKVVEVTELFDFSAAHRLHSAALSAEENLAAFGKCFNANGHGHNYTLAVTVAGVPDARTGAVIAIGELQRVVNSRVIDGFDHKHLNLDCAEFKELNPTVENIARVIFEKLDGGFGGVKLKRVRVWETPKTWAECEG